MRSQRVAVPFVGDHRSNDANGTSDKRGRKAKRGDPYFIQGEEEKQRPGETQVSPGLCRVGPRSSFPKGLANEASHSTSEVNRDANWLSRGANEVSRSASEKAQRLAFYRRGLIVCASGRTPLCRR